MTQNQNAMKNIRLQLFKKLNKDDNKSQYSGKTQDDDQEDVMIDQELLT